jgi:hypothetical protein
MKDARGERRIRFACRENVSEVRDGAGTTGRYDGNADGLAHSSSEFTIEPRTRAICIHRGQENFACATSLGFLRPFNNTASGRLTPALQEDLRVTHRICCVGIATCIDGDNDSLRAKTAANGIDERWIGESGGVDADFIGAGIKNLFCIVGTPNASSHCEGHKKLAGRAANRVEQRGTSLVRGGDVEQDNLVGTFTGVARRKFSRVARINDVDKLNAFDNAAGVDIEAGNDAPG